jgi:anti-sigma factor RsiW
MNTDNSYGEAACGDLAAALVLAADGELTTAEWRAVDQHLEQCAACRSQWAAIARMDTRLSECRAEIHAQSPPDPAVRVRLISALSSPKRSSWLGGRLRHGKWGWATASAAGLFLAALAAWLVVGPENLGRRNTRQPNNQPRGSASAVMAPGSPEVIRVKVSLAPVGDPFLDGSLAESMVLTDVAVGPDGQPRDIRLAE